MIKPVYYAKQILSNVKIKWDETSTYSSIVMSIAGICTAVHHEEYKIYLGVAGGVATLLHMLFPNNLKIAAFDEAVKNDISK